MKEYTYEMEHSWEKQRRPMAFDRIHRRALQYRYSGNEADASSISGKYKHISSNDRELSSLNGYQMRELTISLLILSVPMNRC